jgi:hypothetical protein
VHGDQQAPLFDDLGLRAVETRPTAPEHQRAADTGEDDRQQGHHGQGELVRVPHRHDAARRQGQEHAGREEGEPEHRQTPAALPDLQLVRRYQLEGLLHRRTLSISGDVLSAEETMALPGGTVELLVRKAATSLTGDDLAGWAVRALTDGFDSPALRRLAGLDPPVTCSEAMPVFERAVRELDLAMPDSKDALYRAWLAVLAQEIVDGTRAASEALQLVHRDVLGPLNHPEDLMPWCHLWEGQDPVTFRSLDDGAIEAMVLALARETVTRSMRG